MNKSEFQLKRNSIGGSLPSKLTGAGKMICEQMNYASKDEQEYFKNKKIFTKDALKGTIYKR